MPRSRLAVPISRRASLPKGAQCRFRVSSIPCRNSQRKSGGKPRSGAGKGEKRPASQPGKGAARAVGPVETTLRIVGGDLRGRRIKYSGDTIVRPMKDRTREAMFNLIGPTIVGKHVFDLFAGTGALAIEAISRGAKSATVIERHFPTARIIRDNLQQLGIADRTNLVMADAFFWMRQHKKEFPTQPWAVFVSPPYRFYQERLAELNILLAEILAAAPPSSVFVVEAIVEFDFTKLLPGIAWEQRAYPPALLGMHFLPDEVESEAPTSETESPTVAESTSKEKS